jgi:hypothetical protein
MIVWCSEAKEQLDYQGLGPGQRVRLERQLFGPLAPR